MRLATNASRQAVFCSFQVERSTGAEAIPKRERFSTKRRLVISIQSRQSSWRFSSPAFRRNRREAGHSISNKSRERKCISYILSNRRFFKIDFCFLGVAPVLKD